jgi:hypothetical protein
VKPLPYVVGPHQFGRGLFASRDIATGETILKFRGRLISFSQSCNPRFERYCVQIGPNCYTLTWAPERYINHSCDPNLGFADNRVLRALHDIPAGGELTFDYSTSMAENSWTMVCGCTNRACRRVITDFVDLPQDMKDRYRAMGIIPSWLTPEFEADQMLARAEVLRRRRIGPGGNGNGNGNGNGHR